MSKTSNILDLRPSAKTELQPADLSRIYREILEKTIRNSGTEASPDPYKRSMLKILGDGRRRLSGLWRHGYANEQTERQIQAFHQLKEIRALYVRLDIAKMLKDGSWRVDRQEAIPNAMGTVPFEEIERQMLYFYKDHEKLKQTGSDEDKLIHMDLGCGNAVMGHNLRHNKTKPFEEEGEEGTMGDAYWAEFGYADSIYFTLNDMLRNALKEEYRDDPAITEFIDTISTLLIRKIQIEIAIKKDKGVALSKDEKTLDDLASNPELIKEILPNLNRYIKKLKKYQDAGRELQADDEFLQDDRRSISPPCGELVKEYCQRTPSMLPKKDGEPEVNPFLTKYFNESAWKRDPDNEKRLREIEAEIERVDAALNEEQLIEEHLMLVEERTRLEDDRKVITKSITTNDITIYPHNVVLGSFEDFDETIQPAQSFNFVHSFRSTSHVDDHLYRNLTKQVAERLKPGGIFLDDGKRQSYTRFERIKILMELQTLLGPEYRISTIDDEKGAKSVVIERALKGDGEEGFLFDERKDQLLLEGHCLVPIQDFPKRYPRVMFKNEVIYRMRKYLVGDKRVGAAIGGNKSQALSGGLVFKRMYKANDTSDSANKVEKILDEHIFSQSRWKMVEEMGLGLETSVYQELLEDAFSEVRANFKELDLAVKLVEEGEVPLRPENMVRTITYPAMAAISPIGESRAIRASNLPKNTNLLTASDPAIEMERQLLNENLDALRECLGTAPIRLVEFERCFTNPMMVSTLSRILGQEASLEQRDLMENPNIEIERVNLENKVYPRASKGLYIIGGSLNDSYDPYGQAFTRRFSHWLLSRIQMDEPVRAIGVCFGSQTLLEAFGMLRKKHFTTKKGALQFGAFPSFFADKPDPSLRYLQGKVASVVMTRSGYSILPGYETVGDMKPLAYDGVWNEDEGKLEPCFDLPPTAFSLMDGAVVTSQFHPEVRLTDERHLRILRRHLKRTSQKNREVFDLKRSDFPKWDSQDAIYNENVDIKELRRNGKVRSWIEKDIEMAWLVPTLNNQTRMLLDQLMA